jgi:hypothetical protein
MNKADGTRLVCPQCFSSNQPGDIMCFRCGHGLDKAMLKTESEASKSPTSSSSPESINPYAPPTSGSSPNVTFRISSLLLVIAVIAVCLGVTHENVVLGIILAFVVVPALVYTVIVVEKRSARGSPMAVVDKAGTFLVAIGGVLIIEFSSLVAFCMTCYPIGAAGFAANSAAGLIIGLVVGGIAGIAAGIFATKLLLFRKGRNRRIAGKP